MLRHLSHRTSQVRDLLFVRDAINRKEVMTTKDTNKDGTRSESLAGPAVSFGYETNSSAQQYAGTNLAYHVSSPELIIPGLKAIQSPITSRSGQHARSGYTITGACKFYVPSMDFIRSQKEFVDIDAFEELETNDKLIDMERIVVPKNQTLEEFQNSSSASNYTMNSFNMPGYDLDRIQIKLRSSTTATVDKIEIAGYQLTEPNPAAGVVTQHLIWECNVPIDISVYDVFDIPVKDVDDGDTTSVYVDGTAYTLTANLSTSTVVNNNGYFNVNKMMNETSGSRLHTVRVYFTTAGETIDMHVTPYKAAEWRIESIKDYRDEYMEIRAVRVRGDRASRRRAYG
jgi:hypothetical protein